MIWWSGAFGRSHSHNGMIQLTQCEKSNTWNLRRREAIRHYKAKRTIINKAWNLRRIWTAVKELETFWILYDYHRLSRSLLQNWKSNFGPKLDTRGMWPAEGFPCPTCWKHEKTPVQLLILGFLRAGDIHLKDLMVWAWPSTINQNRGFLQEKSKVFEVRKPIKKHVLVVSFLQLHLLHILRSTSLISNVSLTLKWFKCFSLVIKQRAHVWISVVPFQNELNRTAQLSFTLGSMGRHLQATICDQRKSRMSLGMTGRLVAHSLLTYFANSIE